MSNQLVITSGAKVRSLEGVITGSTGVLNSLPINGSNGIPQLDSNGKILVSQLPNSVMEYKGTWDAATNTPTLVNGTGNQGDVYLCNVAGTVNFGAGPITFFVGDQVIYSGTIWQRASGASGTVTSVAVTESGDALSITGSPIVNSGTINIGFAGTSAQYVAGDGSLITFPSLTGYVPYTGATANLDLGTFNLTADVITGATGSFASSGGSDTFAINHSSGAGIALNITKGGNGEGLYINKTSGSGNAATIIGTLNATTLVKSGGTSSQFLKADGSVDSNTYLTTSAAASTYLPLTGGTLSGLLNISTASYLTSRLKLTNTATGGNIWSLSSGNANNSTNNGLFSIINETLGKNIFSLSPTGNIIIGEDVGTANPAYNLQVIGTNTVIKATDISGNNSNATLQASNSAAYLSAGYATTAIPLIFQTGNTTRLTLAATGEATFSSSVGIGVTANSDRLNVLGTDYNNTAYFLGGSTTGASYGLQIKAGTNSSDYSLLVQNQSGSSTYLKVAGSGNVGIGTTSPKSVSSGISLTIGDGASSVQPYLAFARTASGGYWGGIRWYDNNTIKSFIQEDSDFNLQFGTSNTERMRITSGGNVGIGTSSPVGKFEIASAANNYSTAPAITFTDTLTDANSNRWIIGNIATDFGSFNIASAPNTSSTTFTTRLTIIKSGNVGIGTSSPDWLLKIEKNSSTGGGGTYPALVVNNPNAAGYSAMYFFNGSTNVGGLEYSNSSTNLSLNAYGALLFQTGSGTERMRITSGGEVCVNRTSGSGKFNVDGTFYMYNMSTGAGNSTLKYNTSTGLVTNDSSARIFKKDIVDLEYGLDAVLKMSSKKYKWKSNDTEDLGFIADEMFEIIPEIVYLANNKINKTELQDGEPMGINYDRLVPVLVKAIQEQNQLIENLEARLKTLENK